MDAKCNHGKFSSSISVHEVTLVSADPKKDTRKFWQVDLDIVCSFCKGHFLFSDLPAKIQGEVKTHVSIDRKIARILVTPPLG